MYRFLARLLLLPLASAAAAFPSLAQTVSSENKFAGDAAPRPSAVAQSSAPLTLNTALDQARAGNRAWSAANEEFRAQGGAVLQAGLRPNPTIDINVLDTRRDTRETTVEFTQPIELGNKRLLRLAAADQAREASAAQRDATWLALRADVTTAFYEVLVAQERVVLSIDAVANAQRATAAAARRVVAGKISPVEETRARVAQAAIRLELVRARSDLAIARDRLSSLWGDSTASFPVAVGALEKMPLMSDLPSLMARLASSPTLARAQIEVGRRRALADLERSKRLPDLAVTVGVKRSAELGRKQAMVGVTMPLPVFDRNQGNLLEALRRVDKAGDELSATELELRAALAEAYATLATSRDEVTAIGTDILPGAQSAFDAASTGFEFGKFSFLDVLDAQRTLLQTKADYLRALGAAHRAAADIERLVGGATSTPSQ